METIPCPGLELLLHAPSPLVGFRPLLLCRTRVLFALGNAQVGLLNVPIATHKGKPILAPRGTAQVTPKGHSLLKLPLAQRDNAPYEPAPKPAHAPRDAAYNLLLSFLLFISLFGFAVFALSRAPVPFA